MNIFKKVGNWITSLFNQESANPNRPHRIRYPSPPVYFDRTIYVAKPPKNEDIETARIYCVAPANKTKWILFCCPCECGNVITLSLQNIHKPFWLLKKEISGRPSLHPSIWRERGCFSHFWIRDGRVYWCAGTGRHPNSRAIS